MRLTINACDLRGRRGSGETAEAGGGAERAGRLSNGVWADYNPTVPGIHGWVLHWGCAHWSLSCSQAT
jgi:hypothetical protein